MLPRDSVLNKFDTRDDDQAWVASVLQPVQRRQAQIWQRRPLGAFFLGFFAAA